MIEKIEIRSFKSIENLDLELGQLNVFVGANGSGKSNLLEAIGVLGAAADGKVTDQTLLQRGVRPGVPKLDKSAFPTRKLSHIAFSAASAQASYSVSLNNPLTDPSPAWLYKHEVWMKGTQKLASRGPNMRYAANKEAGLAALKAVEVEPQDAALILLRRLQSYVIYSPTTPVLRGISPEPQPREPLGLSGGSLPDAVHAILQKRKSDKRVNDICRESLQLISWASGFGAAPSASMPLSPAASASSRVIRFTDQYMAKGRNTLSGYDASEGALLVLFLAVLAGHPSTPEMLAIDNADHGLNPGLARQLMEAFAGWITADERNPRQVLMTTHNPAVLDGLPLQNDRIRLFTVDRDNLGRTVVRRVVVNEKMLKKYGRWLGRGLPLDTIAPPSRRTTDR